MRVNQNIPAMFAYRSLVHHQNGQDRALERLSSGLRVNRAADDAAGLAVAESLRAQANGLAQAQRNTGDGISLLQTAEGALNETHAILQRMRTLAVQAANNGVMTSDNLQAIQTEMTQLTAQIDQIAYNTEFNGIPLLDGSFRNKNLQVGANAGDSKSVTIASGIVDAVAATPAGVALWHVQNAIAGLTNPVSFTHTLSDTTTQVDVTLDPMPATVTELVTQLNAHPVFSAAFTAETGSHTLANGDVLPNVNLIVMAKAPGAGAVTAANIPNNAALLQENHGRDATPEHVGGFAASEILGHIDVTREAGSSTNTRTVGGSGSKGFGHANEVPTPEVEVTTTVTWGAGATDAINQIDRAIEIVSRGRTEIGATHKALEHTSASLGVTAENLTMSQSRIRDADMAKEISTLQQRRVLSQAAMEMLKQAQRVPHAMLKLLE